MKIAFIGDIALIGKYNLEKNGDVKSRLKILANKLEEYDYVIGNLESPITDVDNTMVCKSMHLKTSKKNIEILKYLHIDAVSLANNHTFDYGKAGLQDTIEILEKHDIEWYGVNGKFLNKVINGEKISISGFACLSTNGSGYMSSYTKKGINPLTYDSILGQIKLDFASGSYSVMSFHWGDEHTNYPKIEHIELAKKIVDIKDVIIHGHHPHVIQGVQEFNNSVIAYSLGNFIFDDCTSINGRFNLKQNEQNKTSFIMEVEMNNGKIINTSNIGFKEKEHSFEFFDIEDDIKEISTEINSISSNKQYENLRLSQIKEVRSEKFGRRDIKWLISRLNYYSIGARIATIIRSKKYKKVSKKFI